MKQFKHVLVITIDHYDDESDSRHGDGSLVVVVTDPITGHSCGSSTDTVCYDAKQGWIRKVVTSSDVENVVGDCVHRCMKELNKWPQGFDK